MAEDPLRGPGSATSPHSLTTLTAIPMKTYTIHQKQQVQADLGTDQLPSDEFMAMLEEESAADAAGERLTSGYAHGGGAGELEKAVHRATVNALLRMAMSAAGLTNAAMGRGLGVSRQRVGEILATANLEIETVIRVADESGYDVKLSLVPRETGKDVFEAVLPHAEPVRA